jgi:hypothetical protein
MKLDEMATVRCAIDAEGEIPRYDVDKHAQRQLAQRWLTSAEIDDEHRPLVREPAKAQPASAGPETGYPADLERTVAHQQGATETHCVQFFDKWGWKWAPETIDWLKIPSEFEKQVRNAAAWSRRRHVKHAPKEIIRRCGKDSSGG